MTDQSSHARSRSTELTGGSGFTFEDAVAAYFLTALLHEGGAAGIDGTVLRVAVQQDRQGEPLDDVIVDAERFGERRRLSVQVKRDLTISAAPSNEDFRAVIAEARATRAKPDFRVGMDRYGFIARTSGEERLSALQFIISRAQASTTGAEFDNRFRNGGEASATAIALRDELKELVQPDTPTAEMDFYQHFVAMKLDGLEPGGDRFAELANRLGQLVAAGPQQGAALAYTLGRLVREGEGKAQIWTRPSLLLALRVLTRLRVAPSYAEDVSALQELARAYAAEVRQDIKGYVVDRSRYVQRVRETAQRFKFCNISGLPGCGKSAVLRSAVEHAMQDGPVLLLKGDRLQGTSWRGFATAEGLRHRSPTELLAEIGATGTAILFIDGIDRIKIEHRPVVTDLLQAIEREPCLEHWRVVVTSRDQSLEPFRQWVPSSFYRETGIGNVAVEGLDEEEAEALASNKPQLRRLLFATGGVREIARRPFFAAILAEQYGDESGRLEEAPQTESELIAAWWRAGGYNAAPDQVILRQRAIIDLAETGAASLGKAIPARNLKEPSLQQAAQLRQDHIIGTEVEGSVFSFAHDIFFEWAFFRLLIDRASDWPEALRAAGEPPLLARVVSLLSQQYFETGAAWGAELSRLSTPSLRPQWRRAWLLGPPSSQKFSESASHYEAALLADNGALLMKFLVWFQAERTIPNPLVLANTSSGLDGASLVRAADRWSWPSDGDLWWRVIEWVVAREGMFPVGALPVVADVFAVFQNMAGDFRNPTSQAIISTAARWLEALIEDGDRDPRQLPAQSRWSSLRDKQRGTFITALRELLLRSARAYPDPAMRVVERAIATDERSRGEFASIMNFAPILAQTCPERLADLLRVEIFEELPADKQARERGERDEYYERIRAARDKPEELHTDHDRRILSHPYLIGGEKTFDFNDLGIDHHHHYFYPPSPLHQPFASLFQFAPDVACRLVRDIANRATEGWCQIHRLNAPRYGTPIPVEVDFPWGRQRFWGDGRTYAWYLGQGGPQPLDAAFLALSYWAHKSIDGGRPVDDVVREVVEGHDNWAVLGLACSLVLERLTLSPTSLALVATQRLWEIELSR